MSAPTGRDILDGLPFGVALFAADGTCLHANAAFCAILPSPAAPAGRPVGQVAASFFGEEHVAELASGFENVVTDPSACPRCECRGADGLRYECAWRAFAVSEEGAAVLAVADVTRHLEHRDTLEERARLAAVLTGIETTLGYTTDFDDILEILSAEAPDGVSCSGAAVFVRESGGWNALHLRSLPHALIGQRFETEEIPWADEALTRRSLAHGPADGRLGEGEFLAIPLAASGEISALLLLVGTAPFSQPALEFADKLATLASFALENARLQAIERETREALQTALLGVVHEIPGVRLGHLYRSATRRAQVGGDFYELFDLGGDRVGAIIGDVSGKGISAASLAALTKTTVKIHARELGSTAAVLAKTNEVLVGECEGCAFVTVFYCVLDIVTGELRYCGAGHPPPLIGRKGGETLLLPVTSPILGAYRDLAYEERVTTLGNGDVLLLYTDGITEARREGQLYGHERLLVLLSGLGRVDVRELPEIVFEDVFAHVRGDLGDDMAILALSPTRVDEGRRQQQLPL